jgi:hypothetical protein
MNPPNELGDGFDSLADEEEESPAQKVRAEDLLVDLRAGMRTKGFLAKYGLSLSEFEDWIKQLIRTGMLSREEFKAWKGRRPGAEPPPPPPPPSRLPAEDNRRSTTEKVTGNVTTYVINDPEKNNSWALQLFSIKRESIRGAKFKVNLHGRKYAFVVEHLLFRGQVSMVESAIPRKSATPDKREDAIKFISQHGWAKYLEDRAFSANFGESGLAAGNKARLVLLHCRNNTFLAALHTPAPAVNLYVGSTLESIVSRLGKSVDTRGLKFS